MTHYHLHLSLSQHQKADEIFSLLHDFIVGNKLGDVLWSTYEKNTLSIGIVMKKENSKPTMQKIKEHLESMGVTDVGFVKELKSGFDEEFVRKNYKLGFLE